MPTQRASGLIVVAEDSGLVIPALGGDPGVQSARFLGAGVSYPVRFAEIFRRLATADGSRHAEFVTALCVARGDEILFEVETSIGGEIATAPAGDHGFGYDPIFFYSPLGKTTGELTIAEKSAVSHRARAFRDFAAVVQADTNLATKPQSHEVRNHRHRAASMPGTPRRDRWPIRGRSVTALR